MGFTSGKQSTSVYTTALDAHTGKVSTRSRPSGVPQWPECKASRGATNPTGACDALPPSVCITNRISLPLSWPAASRELSVSDALRPVRHVARRADASAVEVGATEPVCTSASAAARGDG